MPSKLGFHFLRKGGPDPDRVAAAGCRIVKVVHDQDNLVNRLSQHMPEATIIVRNFIGLSGEDDFLRWGGHRDPKGAARRWVEETLSLWGDLPENVYLEGWNEMSAWEHMGAYAEAEAERVRLLHREGRRAAIGGFAVGTPPLPNDRDPTKRKAWRRFLPALRAAHEYDAILTLHEYGGPWLWFMYDGWQWDHPRGAYWTNHDCPGNRRIKPGGYLFGRWLWVREHILKPNDLERLPIALTEFGIDHVVFSDRVVGHPIAGWQSAREWWAHVPQPANPDDPRHNWRPRPDGAQYLMQQMAWADDVMRSDPYMLGATFFKVGMPTEWHTFNAGPELENLMLAHIQRLRDEPVPAEPQPEPAPAPTSAPSPTPTPRPTPFGDIGIPNPRPYVLLPPTGDPGEWLRAASQTTLAQANCTFGFSPDEAVRGAPNRRIYIINPRAWDQSVLRYIDQHYPDLQISSVLVNTPGELRRLTGLGSDLL